MAKRYRYLWVALLLVAGLALTFVIFPKNNMNEKLNRPLAQGELSGEQMKAFLAAYKDFNFGIFSKKLENYTVLINENSTGYKVTFIPKLLKSEVGLKGGSSALGQTVRYDISKDTYQIAQKSYAR